jgi:nicotinamidase/pyrazinamidase
VLLGRRARPPPRVDHREKIRARGRRDGAENVTNRVVLWDVDTQVDFMLPHGKLYVPGAEETAPAMAKLVAAAREGRVVHVASADDHELNDPEISDEPDWRNTFPPHCLRGTRGAEKIPETEQLDPLPLTLTPYPPGLVPGFVEGRRELLLLKKTVNVFTNPNTDPLLQALDPDEIVVFGVATDVCDDATIRGFLQRGLRVRFVEDAARGLDEDRVVACTAAWRERGVEFTTADEVADSL